MEKRWKRYAVFISSTFLDMDAERDAIKFIVIPQLNERFRRDMVEFQAVDLRSGINTEYMSESRSESRVLNACFSSIDSSRPFFIGLLGGRYGWIPSPRRLSPLLKRMNDSQRGLLGAVDGLSVTELEMLYGAIGSDGKYLDHSLFYYRLPDSYGNIPASKLEVYLDDNNPSLNPDEKAELTKKRDHLLNQVRDVIGRSKRETALFTEYSLEYNTEKDGFSNMDVFCRLVLEQMTAVVRDEIEHSDEDSQYWSEQDTLYSQVLQRRFVADMVDRTKGFSTKDHHLFITGEPGSGKTVLLSQLYEACPAPESNKHIAFVGLTPFSGRVRTILLRWLAEMGVREKNQDIPDIKSLPNNQLFDLFRDNAPGHYFFLDSPEQLPSEEQGLAWVGDTTWIGIAGDSSSYAQAKRLSPDFKKVEIEPLTREERRAIVEQYSEIAYFDVPGVIRRDMERSSSTPARLTLLLTLLTSLTSDDYKNIRSHGGLIQDINRHLEDLYFEMSKLKNGLFLTVFERMTKLFTDGGRLLDAFRYLAVSPAGLRESDLELLLKDTWDQVSFRRVVACFQSFFTCDPNTISWKIVSKSLASDLLPEDRLPLYRDIARMVLTLPDSDWLKRDMGIYFAIKSHCPEEALPYLGGQSHFESYDDVSSWYFFASNYLENDTDAYRDIDATCQAMNASRIPVFLKHYLSYGCGFGNQTALHLSLVRKHLISVSVEEMDEIAAFDYAWLMMDAELYLNLEYADCSEREVMLNCAIKGFARTLALNPGHKAAKNMLMAAGTSLMDVYTKQHRFDDFKRLYVKLKSI